MAYLYRYERGSFDGENGTIYLTQFPILEETEKSYKINLNGNQFKWILKNAIKRFAYPTIAEAQTNFIARTRRSITIQTSQIKKSVSYLRAKFPTEIRKLQ